MPDYLSSWTAFFGRLHPLLVHFPVALLILGALFDLFFKNKKKEIVLELYFWGLITSIFSCIAGYFLQQEGGYPIKTLENHQFFGIAVVVLSASAFVSKRYLQQAIPVAAWLRIFWPLSIISSVIVAGHLGANLTHGADFLQAKTPQPVAGWLGFNPQKVNNFSNIKSTLDTSKALVYKDVIAPILEEKCYQCHAAQKQKGDLRLDTPKYMLQGGEDGAALVPGSVSTSAIITRALLPLPHEDHMPPKEKPQLTVQELALLQWWIAHGASFDKPLSALAKTPEINAIFKEMAEIKPGQNKGELSDIYTKNVAAANPKLLAQLRSVGMLVQPISQTSNLLEINTINCSQFSDKEAKMLESLADQIVWLKAGNIALGEQGWASIGKLLNLTKLKIEGSNINDKYLVKLYGLKNLESLNITNTTISDTSAEFLARYKKLKYLYLWHSQLSGEGRSVIQKSNPRLRIEMGWQAPLPLVDSVQKLK